MNDFIAGLRKDIQDTNSRIYTNIKSYTVSYTKSVHVLSQNPHNI